MRTQMTQPQGSTLRFAIRSSIARATNSKLSEVDYISTSLSIDSLKYLFDKTTETVWVNTATGTVVSWVVNDDTLTLVTNTGNFTLYKENTNGTTYKWLYNNGYAVGGETSITVDLGTDWYFLRSNSPSLPRCRGNSIVH